MYDFDVTPEMVIEYTNRIRNLKELVDYGAASYGHKTFCKYKRNDFVECKSFIDLKRDTEAFSRALDSKGIAEGCHIALAGATSYEWVIAYLGTVNSGRVIVPLDSKGTVDDSCELIEYADAEVLIYDKSRQNLADHLKTMNSRINAFFYLDEGYGTAPKGVLSISNCIREFQGEYEASIDPDSLSTIIFTSGTTGGSKGVMLSHRSLTTNAIITRPPIKDFEVKLSILPIHHCFCFTADILVTLFVGSTVAFCDNLTNLLSNMQLFRPGMMMGVPQIWKMLYGAVMKAYADNPGKDIVTVRKEVLGDNLRALTNGGARLNSDLYNKITGLGIYISEGYGLTECSPVVSVSDSKNYVPGSLGCLCYTYEVKLVDEELCLRGPCVMMGYYKDPIATASVIDSEGWLHTGDLCHIDENNNLFLIGRKKNLIILSNGKNVSPEELERMFLEISLVKDVMVFEKDDSICAEIYPDYDNISQVKDIQRYMMEKVFEMNKKLPVYKRVASFTIRNDDFERTSSGKIIRNKH